jgi:hydroxymethylbilane synthase
MITIGSRGSQLALWQARWVQSQLEAAGETCRIEIITTTGDRITGVPLAKVGTKGLFTKEIEDALLDGSVDLAVHSLKDMPTDLPPGLTLAAIPVREDVRDAMVGSTIADLKPGALVGTSSLRRTAQLKALRPDLRVESVRGNVDTRLRKLDEGQYDAILLAAAGLRRLGLEARIAEYIDPLRMCPAAGQGALAIETREDRTDVAQRLLEHKPTRVAITAERALLGALGGGCQVPIGAHATVDGDDIHLQGLVAAADGNHIVRGEKRGLAAHAAELGRALAAELIDQGAGKLLEQREA